MLDEVVLARASGACCRFKATHGVPLVEAREDDDFVLLCVGRRCALRRFDVDEAAEQVEPGMTLPHLFPQVVGAIPVLVRWVPLALVVAHVEGKKHGVVASETCCHHHLIGVDGEVDDGASGEGRVVRVAVLAVLLDSVAHVLACEFVLEFCGGDGDAVDG